MTAWPLLPLRRVARVVNGGTPTPDEANWGGDVLWATPVDIGAANGEISDTQRTLTRMGAMTGSRIVPANSILVSTRAPIGYVATTAKPMAFNQGCKGLLLNDRVDARFLYYQLASLTAELNRRGQGTTFAELSADSLASVEITLPPMDQQRRIVHFLDAETARIDRLIFLRSQQVGRLMEMLATRATELTGRAALRTSPKEGRSSQQVPLRRAISNIQTGTTPPGLRDGQPDRQSSDMAWYTPAAIDDMLKVGDAAKHLDAEPHGVPTFAAGSVLVVGIGESLGKVGYLDHCATGNQQLTALTAAKNADAQFLAWQLWAAREEIREWSQYSRVRIINNEVLNAFPIWLPEKNIQISTRVALEERMAHTARFRSFVAAFCQTMRERRQALIMAAVAGQFDITTARGADLS